MTSSKEEQSVIWDYFKPRHTHAWNMLVMSWAHLDGLSKAVENSFEVEYHWENFILRIWLYRATFKTLIKIEPLKTDANNAISEFDDGFSLNGENHLKAIRDMIEHFDDYAAGVGKGPAKRRRDLDPWRQVNRDRYNRGEYRLEREKSYLAANKLRSETKRLSAAFIEWYKTDNRRDN